MKARTSPAGFTLVELILAMALFSLVMVIVSVGIIQVMRIYQSNLATRRTQQAARLVVEDVTREVRLATRVARAVPGELCLEGSTTIRYRLPGGGPVLLKEQLQGGCTSTTVINSTELTGSANSEVAARRFNVTPIRDNINNISSVGFTVAIATGPADFIDTSGDRVVCQPGPGSQFCSATSYSSVVTIRGGSL